MNPIARWAIVVAVASCEFNEKINVNPQAMSEVLPLSACPADSPMAQNLDLLLVSDRDQLVEQGTRVRRGAQDHCTVVGSSIGDPDECVAEVELAEGEMRAAGDDFEKAAALGLRGGAVSYCDAGGRCGDRAGAGSPLHLAILVDNGAEDNGGNADPDGARITAAQDLAYGVLCADGGTSACPFSADDEVRVWELGGEEVNAQGGWTRKPSVAADRLEALRGTASGDGPIWDGLVAAAEALAEKCRGGDTCAIMLVTTNGRTSSGVPESLNSNFPVHVVALDTIDGADEENLRAKACSTGGSLQVVASPSSYDETARRVRMALRGRWRVPVTLGADPGAGVYEITARASFSVEGAAPIENAGLTFRVQGAEEKAEEQVEKKEVEEK
ncbi:MAG: hypothetical protein AABZ30_10285 [Myxococcota bacterium]